MSVRERRFVGFGAAALSAILLFVAGEPAGLGLLAWVALVPLTIVVFQEQQWRWAWLYGLCHGVVYFGIELSWIFLFGWIAWTPLTIVLALYPSVAILLASVARRHLFAPLMLAGAWAGMELVRDRWPVGGYSWGSVGTTQVTVPVVRWLAGSVGVYGITFLLVFVTALFAYRIVTGRWSLLSIVLVGVLFVAFAAVDLARFSSPPEGRPLRVAVIQGGVPRPPFPDQRDRILASHLLLTREAVKREGRVDLVVWPEDAVGIGGSRGAFGRVQALARQLRTPFIVGHSVVAPGERFLNLVQSIDRNGRLVDTYRKRHPVPFGEYVPFGFFRRFVGTLQSEVPFDLAPGKAANVFTVDGYQVATPICFESVFPRDFLDFAHNGADLFVLSTNNASFERSYASQQHMAHTRMRALETREWVVQAALAGISGSIAPDGRVSHQTGLFEAAAFVTEVQARPAHSLYVHIGDTFPALFAGMTLVLLIAYAVTEMRRRAPTNASATLERV